MEEGARQKTVRSATSRKEGEAKQERNIREVSKQEACGSICFHGPVVRRWQDGRQISRGTAACMHDDPDLHDAQACACALESRMTGDVLSHL